MEKEEKQQAKKFFDIRPGEKADVIDLRKVKDVSKHFFSKNGSVGGVGDIGGEKILSFFDPAESRKTDRPAANEPETKKIIIEKQAERVFLKNDSELAAADLPATIVIAADAASAENSVLPEETAPNNPPDKPVEAKDAANRKFSLKACVSFFLIAAFFAASVWSFNLVEKALALEKRVGSLSLAAFSDLAGAASDISGGKITSGSIKFKAAVNKFGKARSSFDRWGAASSVLLDYLPLPSVLASKRSLFNAGQYLALAGNSIVGSAFYSLDSLGTVPLPEIYSRVEMNFRQSVAYLDRAIADLDAVDINDVPEAERAKFAEAKEKIPALKNVLENLLDNDSVAMKVLGVDRPKKYLLLFQNNNEMRASGGFIGTYGILQIDKGLIKKMSIDDIYNPDGQLTEKIVPPAPVQRISDAWSMHDANWFADFPESAKKVSLFYEKTGGPTVDGVMAVTPVLLQKLLELTGPIDLPEYGQVVNANNFIEVTQYEVEVSYDKTLNQPKKFIADLWQKMEAKIFNLDKQEVVKMLGIFDTLLREKQILFYANDQDVENFIAKNGWGGQLISTDGDFLSVVHSNLGGYKTDGVISEEIKHRAEIQADGTIIDTVDITRSHLGGSTPYDWWNRVNVDYLRVYVPLGSQLLLAKGHTWEKPWRTLHPFDYSRFRKDPDVAEIESTLVEDPDSGTQIFHESGKTVFGNWVFVSPGESVTVTYKYKLPFKINSDGGDPAKYSLLAEKQSGSMGSKLSGELVLPENFKVIWSYPDSFVASADNDYKIDTDLAEDKTYGAIWQKY